MEIKIHVTDLRAASIVYVIWYYATVDTYKALRAERSVKFLGSVYTQGWPCVKGD